MTSSASPFAPLYRPALPRAAQQIRSGAVVSLLTMMVVGLLFAVSSLMLNRLHIPYDISGGSPFSKIHPATYLASIAMFGWLMGRFNPIAELESFFAQNKGTAVFLLCLLVVALDILLAQPWPFSMILDSFLLTVMVFMLLSRLEGRYRTWLVLAVHLAMAANAGLGLVEFVTGRRLTPIVAAGVYLTSDWRSSAFLGHPLINAVITGSYLLMLMLGGGRELPLVLRVLTGILQLMAMLAFGGRVASVLAFTGVFVLMSQRAATFFSGGRLSLLHMAGLVLLVPIVLAGVMIAWNFGLLDRFLDRFSNDDGSTDARLSMLLLFEWVPLRDIILGPDPEWIASLQRTEGMDFGIESFQIAFIFQYGIIIAFFLCVGIVCFCYDLWHKTDKGSLWVILYFLAVASTSMSIAGKTTVFAIFVALLMLMLPSNPALSRAELSR